MPRAYLITLVAALGACGTSAPPTGLPDAIAQCDDAQIGSDCGSCLTQSVCTQCYETVDAPGLPTFHALQKCILCGACYHACNVATAGVCTSGPDDRGVCDIGGPSESACDTCLKCAQDGPCSPDADACVADPQCLDYVRFAGAVCGALPM
jgi:hypothetical protein